MGTNVKVYANSPDVGKRGNRWLRAYGVPLLGLSFIICAFLWFVMFRFAFGISATTAFWLVVWHALIGYGLYNLLPWARWLAICTVAGYAIYFPSGYLAQILFELHRNHLSWGQFFTVKDATPTLLSQQLLPSVLLLLVTCVILLHPQVRHAFHRRVEERSGYLSVIAFMMMLFGAACIYWGHSLAMKDNLIFPAGQIMLPALLIVVVAIGLYSLESWARWIGIYLCPLAMYSILLSYAEYLKYRGLKIIDLSTLPPDKPTIYPALAIALLIVLLFSVYWPSVSQAFYRQWEVDHGGKSSPVEDVAFRPITFLTSTLFYASAIGMMLYAFFASYLILDGRYDEFTLLPLPLEERFLVYYAIYTFPLQLLAAHRLLNITAAVRRWSLVLAITNCIALGSDLYWNLGVNSGWIYNQAETRLNFGFVPIFLTIQIIGLIMLWCRKTSVLSISGSFSGYKAV